MDSSKPSSSLAPAQEFQFRLNRLVSWGDVRAKQLEYKVYDGSVLVDSGDGNRMLEVYGKCAEFGHKEIVGNREHWVCWKATKGEDQKSFPFFNKKARVDLPFRWPLGYGDPRSGKEGQGQGNVCPLVQFSNPTLKDILAKLRDGKGAAWLTYEGVCDDWNKHMYSERRIKTWDRHGMDTGTRWENIGRRQNHLWDCEVLQVLAASLEGIVGEQIPSEEPKP